MAQSSRAHFLVSISRESSLSRAHARALIRPGRLPRLRRLTHRTWFAEGAFVVNCTDHIGQATNYFDPIVSEDGLVLAPQMLCGFTGPTMNHVTHAWYLGTLGVRLY